MAFVESHKGVSIAIRGVLAKVRRNKHLGHTSTSPPRRNWCLDIQGEIRVLQTRWAKHGLARHNRKSQTRRLQGFAEASRAQRGKRREEGICLLVRGFLRDLPQQYSVAFLLVARIEQECLADVVGP